MHARPQEKVGEDPEADVVIAGQKQVEEPRLLCVLCVNVNR